MSELLERAPVRLSKVANPRALAHLRVAVRQKAPQLPIRIGWSHYLVGLRVRSFHRTLLATLQSAYQVKRLFATSVEYDGYLTPRLSHSAWGHPGDHMFWTALWEPTSGGRMYWGDKDWYCIREGHTYRGRLYQPVYL